MELHNINAIYLRGQKITNFESLSVSVGLDNGSWSSDSLFSPYGGNIYKSINSSLVSKISGSADSFASVCDFTNIYNIANNLKINYQSHVIQSNERFDRIDKNNISPINGCSYNFDGVKANGIDSTTNNLLIPQAIINDYNKYNLTALTLTNSHQDVYLNNSYLTLSLDNTINNLYVNSMKTLFITGSGSIENFILGSDIPNTLTNLDARIKINNISGYNTCLRSMNCNVTNMVFTNCSSFYNNSLTVYNLELADDKLIFSNNRCEELIITTSHFDFFANTGNSILLPESAIFESYGGLKSCYGLQSLTINSTDMGNSISCCLDLEHLEINNVTSFANIYNCPKLTYFGGNRVTSIKDLNLKLSSFEGNSINYYSGTFTNSEIQSAKFMCDGKFRFSCDNLESLEVLSTHVLQNLPNELKTLKVYGNYTTRFDFSFPSKLEHVELPNVLSTFNMISNLDTLTNLTYVDISNAYRIRNFYLTDSLDLRNFTNLTGMIFSNTNVNNRIKSLYINTITNFSIFPNLEYLSINCKTGTLNSSALNNCSNIKTLDVNISSIEDGAIENVSDADSIGLSLCSSQILNDLTKKMNIKTFNYSGASVDSTLPAYFSDWDKLESVKCNSIGNFVNNGCFDNCSNLRSLACYFSQTANIITNRVFKNCDNLRSLSLLMSLMDTFNFYALPSKMKDIRITNLNSKTFSIGNINLLSELSFIMCNNGAISENNFIFNDMSNLRQFLVKTYHTETNKAVTINFENCYNIVYNLFSRISCDYRAPYKFNFRNCFNLSYAIIPKNFYITTPFCPSCFQNCYNLTRLDYTTISTGSFAIQSIPDNCFENCYNVNFNTTYSSTDNVNLYSFGQRAFANCFKLYNLTCWSASKTSNAGIKIIGDEAFINCSNLSSCLVKNSTSNIMLSLPVSSSNFTKSFGSNVFYKCSKLSQLRVWLSSNNYGNVSSFLSTMFIPRLFGNDSTKKLTIYYSNLAYTFN